MDDNNLGVEQKPQSIIEQMSKKKKKKTFHELGWSVSLFILLSICGAQRGAGRMWSPAFTSHLCGLLPLSYMPTHLSPALAPDTGVQQ